jgi:Resolvase, N terminal domain
MAKRKKAPAARAKRVALYLRVSTTGQTTANQHRELKVVGQRHGWQVVQVFSDNGIRVPRAARTDLASTHCSRAWRAVNSIWSRPGRSIAWGDHCRI